MKNILATSAAIEAGAGVVLLAAPSMFTHLLLGESFDTPGGLAVARVAGAALLSLGVACWFASRDGKSRTAKGVGAAMLLYNISAVAVITYAGLSLNLSGSGMLPASLLHAALAGWCIARLPVVNASTTA